MPDIVRVGSNRIANSSVTGNKIADNAVRANNIVAGSGGSGRVVIRCTNNFKDGTTTGSPTFTNDGTYKIYAWDGSGSISW